MIVNPLRFNFLFYLILARKSQTRIRRTEERTKLVTLVDPNHLLLSMKRLQQFNYLIFYNNASVYMLILSLLCAEKTRW